MKHCGGELSSAPNPHVGDNLIGIPDDDEACCSFSLLNNQSYSLPTLSPFLTLLLTLSPSYPLALLSYPLTLLPDLTVTLTPINQQNMVRCQHVNGCVCVRARLRRHAIDCVRACGVAHRIAPDHRVAPGLVQCDTQTTRYDTMRYDAIRRDAMRCNTMR